MKKVRERTMEEILADPEGGHTEVVEVESPVSQEQIIRWMKYAIAAVLVIVALAALMTHGSEIFKVVASVGSVVAAALIYFLPAVVAERRGHHQKQAILLLNLFFGWSVIGWLVALIWAATAVRNN